jgi:hypothetical protein
MISNRICILAFAFWAIMLAECSVSVAQDIAGYKAEEILEDSTYQISLGPTLPNLICHCLVIQATIGGHFSTLYSFRISRSSVPTIDLSVTDTIQGWAGSREYRFADLNFDGYKDLRYIVDRDGQGTALWHVWILDLDSLAFVFSEDFSKLPEELSLDAINKTIAYSGYSFYAIERVTWDRQYKVFGSRLLVLEESQTSDFAGNGESFSDPDSSRTKTDKYKYDYSTSHPIVLEHTEIIELVKQGKRYITTIINKRTGDHMIPFSKSEQVLDDK